MQTIIGNKAKASEEDFEWIKETHYHYEFEFSPFNNLFHLSGFLEQGEHKFQWFHGEVSCGTYFSNVTGNNFFKTLKMILEK